MCKHLTDALSRSLYLLSYIWLVEIPTLENLFRKPLFIEYGKYQCSLHVFRCLYSVIDGGIWIQNERYTFGEKKTSFLTNFKIVSWIKCRQIKHVQNFIQLGKVSVYVICLLSWKCAVGAPYPLSSCPAAVKCFGREIFFPTRSVSICTNNCLLIAWTSIPGRAQLYLTFEMESSNKEKSSLNLWKVMPSCKVYFQILVTSYPYRYFGLNCHAILIYLG